MTKESIYLTYTVKWCRKTKQFVGTCAEHPKLSFYASDRETAMSGIQNLVSKLSKDDEMKELLVNTAPITKQILMENH